MNDQISPEQFTAIKEFVEGLRGCFENYQRANSLLDIGSGFINTTMDYVLQTLNIHKDLAELKVDRYLMNMEKAVGK